MHSFSHLLYVLDYFPETAVRKYHLAAAAYPVKGLLSAFGNYQLFGFSVHRRTVGGAVSVGTHGAYQTVRNKPEHGFFLHQTCFGKRGAVHLTKRVAVLKKTHDVVRSVSEAKIT